MKVSLLCFWLLLASLPLQAEERSKMENEISQILGFEQTVEHYFVEYKKQLFKRYPKLTEEYVESNYGSVFQYGKKRYMNAYMKGLSVYSDDELRQLIDFYKSDKGKWIVKKNLESNVIVLDDLALASDDFNKVFIENLKSQ
ncbi:DUF2059 domain-containing protein [Vibrio sinaloensis]|uniref:DUF2059 domain-containing protein n=1 Tax=Photobacterium sp. (strain ATCC 43367) TaxID=379097 RepID=UPI00057CCF2F|nr:DUF2059 domain-containing protein [Vibrio sinaloensis]KHT44737.1 hypothetical protein RJ47_10760 [Vibrio sinaloensis]